ncbi:tyrosine-type recombinase/integrase [Lentibacillus sediminis]|uniref:tyrosine-type recombinase/integrase n=1 Tax=Lentibacillus sediminis TaxID=1940529 RepID=UPI000C1BFC46|nr:site-specific integrase [Lentibacillus sediminis]
MSGKRGWIRTPQELKKHLVSDPELVNNKGTYMNLMKQTNKIAKHAKGISITSQRQYYNHFDQFCRFIADNYNLKNIKNIQDKHLAAFVQERQNEAKSAASIKQDLAAVRYYHDQIPNTKYFLSDNKTLGKKFEGFSLEKRQFGGINRRATEFEYKSLLNIANQRNQPQIAQIIQLAREQGLRVHEIVRLNRADAEKAFRENQLTVKGKGGLIRTIPLHEKSKEVLKAAMSHVNRGDKLFVKRDEKAHTVIQRTKDFIRYHRSKVHDPANNRLPGVHITMHSFRHAYAKEQYDRFIALGMQVKDARLAVSKLIGHSREDVTKIYLGE